MTQQKPTVAGNTLSIPKNTTIRIVETGTSIKSTTDKTVRVFKTAPTRSGKSTRVYYRGHKETRYVLVPNAVVCS